MSYDKVLFRHDEPHGPGDVYFVWQKGPSGTLVATTGSDGTVAIYNRQGQLIDRIILQSLCSGFSWDCEGDYLGIITSNSSQITLWDANSHRKQILDTGVRDTLSCIVWAKNAPIMAVGTSRGNLVIYNNQTLQRIPILGKHSKRIICGAWSTENILTLGSEDKSFSISNAEGDSKIVVPLRDTPSDIYFARMKTDEKIQIENTVSMILGKRTLYLYFMPEPDTPIELGFQSRYGSLIQHKWFGDGYILLGFSHGHLVAISTHIKDIGQELWQVKNHRDILTGIAYCQALDVVASCGDNNIKIHSISNLHETERILTLPDQLTVQMIDWSNDGQLLAVTTAQGTFSTFVTKLQIIYAVSTPLLAILSSIQEISLYMYANKKCSLLPNKLGLEVEPSFIALGPYHLAAGMNNHVWFYDITKIVASHPVLLNDREFVSEIDSMQLNRVFCAAFCGKQLILQYIDSGNSGSRDRQTESFPSAVGGLDSSVITSMKLTNEFLIFATDLGDIVYFSLELWSVSIKYRHVMGIKHIYSDLEGAKLVIVDDNSQGFVFLPTCEESIMISDFPKNCEGILWDFSQADIFMAFDKTTCFTFKYVRYSVKGANAYLIDETKLNSGQVPLMLHNGEVLVYSDGKCSVLSLTHLLTPAMDINKQVDSLIKLRRPQDAFELCEQLNDDALWRKFGELAIENLDSKCALKIFQRIADPSVVLALEELQFTEDNTLLCASCCILLGRIDEAKKFFSKSRFQHEALELCRDVHQWKPAILLANTLAPDQLPFILREHAQQLEFNGEYSEALCNYEMGLQKCLIDETDVDRQTSASPDLYQHMRLCKVGLARTLIKTGDFRRGIQLAVELNDKQLYFECGESLIKLGYLAEGANLFEKGEFWNEACLHYIQLQIWSKVKKILPYAKNNKLHAAYAKAKLSQGNFLEAISNFKISGDVDLVIKIYLELLSDPHSAAEVVLESGSIAGAEMLGKFYQKIGDYEQALQFLVMAGCKQSALSLAQKHNRLKLYGELLERYGNAQHNDYIALANYFDVEKFTLLAGRYYYLGRDFAKALRLLLKASTFCNEEDAAISLAIDCVATSKSDQLSNQLIKFLLGEVDGAPKNPKHLFRLYMAQNQYKDAAKTAVIIANHEQVAGNYQKAHHLLFSMFQDLRRNNLSIPGDVRQNLILLHRYSLVRIHVKLGNHVIAAKLLVNVAANISQFPTHAVPILTSTVIECHRAGLEKSAFTYALMLMRPEYRNQIDLKYSKKIENIVRKAPKGIMNYKDDFTDEAMECPICDANLPSMDVTCYHCKAALPICIATGQHILKENMVACPECDFPCLREEMQKILSEHHQCPMCNETVDSNRLMNVEDIRSYILPIL